MLEQFRKADMKLSPQKCSFLQKEVSYLGHVIGSGGISVDPQKNQECIRLADSEMRGRSTQFCWFVQLLSLIH